MNQTTIQYLKGRVKPKGRKTAIVSYSIPTKLDEMIREAAQRAGCSQSAVAQAALEAFLQVNIEVAYAE